MWCFHHVADFWEGSETNSVSNDKPLTDKNDDEGLFGAEKLEHYLWHDELLPLFLFTRARQLTYHHFILCSLCTV